MVKKKKSKEEEEPTKSPAELKIGDVHLVSYDHSIFDLSGLFLTLLQDKDVIKYLGVVQKKNMQNSYIE